MTALNTILTWQFNVNQSIAGGTNTSESQMTLLAIKNSFKGFAQSPWTVQGSSSSAAAGHDGVDRWSTFSNVVWAANGVAHSWIVLKQTGLGSNFQLLLDCTSSSSLLYVAVSPSAGFTGGTTTARPTATDQIIISNSAAWGGQATGSGNAFNNILHVMQSTDGYATNVIITRSNRTFPNANSGTTPDIRTGGVPTGVWHFSKCRNAISQWTFPYVFYVDGNTAEASTTPGNGLGMLSRFTNAATFTSAHNSTSISLKATIEGTGGTSLLSLLPVPNEISGESPSYPVGLFSMTLGYRGRMGELYDFWFAPLPYGHGSMYADGYGTAKKFIQLENIILPWNGTNFLMG